MQTLVFLSSNRSVSIASRALIGIFCLTSGVLTAQAGGRYDDGSTHYRHDSAGESSLPLDARPDFYTGLGINVQPELEHWRSNYRPDSYRLYGYDGRDTGQHVCRGEQGTTLSTTKIECPPGQRNTDRTRRYSTEAD